MSSRSAQAIRLTGSLSRTRARRRWAHALVGLASWIVLAALWAWQLAVFVPSTWLGGIELIAALAAGWACLSVAWVAWCRSIYRRRHRRTTALERVVNFEHDALGREVLAPPGIAELRGQVLISVPEPGVKRYELATRASEPTSSATGDPADPAQREAREVA